jgi:hypothetical protein
MYWLRDSYRDRACAPNHSATGRGSQTRTCTSSEGGATGGSGGPGGTLGASNRAETLGLREKESRRS